MDYTLQGPGYFAQSPARHCSAGCQQVIKVHPFRANGDNERRKHGGQDGEHDKAASTKQE